MIPINELCTGFGLESVGSHRLIDLIVELGVVACRLAGKVKNTLDNSLCLLVAASLLACTMRREASSF